ncbi:protein CDC73 homolog [Silene latifolia]|uniref:protein CDC73 homolog n=1 Tax=Silene latifolia TaxID=37657 RepID=UPI003D7815AB
MDPLTALRDYTIRGELDNIHQVGDVFQFSNQYTFPSKLETPYRSKQGNLYTLETLVFFVKYRHLRPPDYIKSATNHGVSTVTFVDRKPLLDYLEGRSASSESIQFVPPNPNSIDDYRPDDPDSAAWDLDPAAPTHAHAHAPAAEDSISITLIREIERPLRDRNAILQCRNRDFYSIYVGAMKREEEKKRETPSRKEGSGVVVSGVGVKGRQADREEGGGGGSGVKAKMLKGGGKVGEGVPIILVPSAANTLITIYNVKEFLEDGVFIPTDVKMKQMKGPKPECVTVQKKFSRDKDKVMTAYEVRDKPSTLKVDDWDRVVAVFVLGKEWQFKEWPIKDHVDIFNKVVGFFMRFEDDSIESAKVVKQWNVKIISISKNKRHQDRAAALEVWSKLEEFVARSRS